jgi:hypothetical protein
MIEMSREPLLHEHDLARRRRCKVHRKCVLLLCKLLVIRLGLYLAAAGLLLVKASNF